MSEDRIGFSEEERELIKESVRRLLADQWPPLKALEMAHDKHATRSIWKQLAGLSLPDLGRDPEMGGLREILLVFEELGRACCPAPLLGSVVFNLLAASSLDLVAEIERDKIEAPATIAVAFGPFDGDAAAGEMSIKEGRISGSNQFVEGGQAAERYVIFVNEPSGVAIVEAGAGSSIEETPALSLPTLATLDASNTPARFYPVSAERLRNVVQIARLVCAARAVGSAQRAYQLVVEHVSSRRQFDQLIGQFQAVQHRLVDNLTRLDGARLTLDAAATAYDRSLPTWSIFANLALAHLNPGLRQLAIDMHQLMGAIGYSEEHELPRHFRQIHGNLARFGGVARARAEIGGYLVGKSKLAA